MTDRLDVLERLGAELERVARAAPPPSRRPRRSALALAGLALGLGGGAVAVAAATDVLGSPVEDPTGVAVRPDAGRGVARGGGLTALRVADPAGGAPWGLRLTRTSRQQGCAQAGRVVDGQLGFLGQDGQFGDDHRFHPLGADVETERECLPLDGAGHPWLAVARSGLPASGSPIGCTAPGAYGRNLQGRPQTCPASDERIVLYGAVGPQAVGVEYVDETGRTQRAATSGPEGAYLVVTRPAPGRRVTGQWTVLPSPGSGLRAVLYRDGSRCDIPDPRRLGGARPCPQRGFVPVPTRRVDLAQVTSPVTVTLEPHPRRPSGPGIVGRVPRVRVAHVRFTARVAASARSTYELSYRTPYQPPKCPAGGAGSIDRDVRADEHIDHEIFVDPSCRGPLRVEVRFYPQASVVPGANRDAGLLVGRASIPLPAGGRRRP